jgi:hypothetical protein
VREMTSEKLTGIALGLHGHKHRDAEVLLADACARLCRDDERVRLDVHLVLHPLYTWQYLCRLSFDARPSIARGS